jgi:hypothetical protein
MTCRTTGNGYSEDLGYTSNAGSQVNNETRYR